MSDLTTSDFLNKVFEKAGIDVSDESVKKILSEKSIEIIPADLAEKALSNVYSLEGAKNTPEIFNAVRANTFLKLERMGKKLMGAIDPEADFMDYLEEFRSKNDKGNVVDAYDSLFDTLKDKVQQQIEASKGGGGNTGAGNKGEEYKAQIEQLKQALDARENDILTLNESHKTELQATKSEFSNKQIGWLLGNQLDSLPLQKTVTGVDHVKRAVYDGIINEAKNKFVLRLEDGGNIGVYSKENPELKATGGNKEPLKITDVVTELAKPYLDPSGGKGGGSESGNNNGGSKKTTTETGRTVRPSFL